MAIIKCKMCGGDLILTQGQSVAECEFCGSRQTVPVADNEKKLTLFARANRLRATCDFDKAAGIYESIVADFPEEAEAYWGLVLCKYGIEYVDDPATGKKIPTCHRSSFDSIMEDGDYEQALENGDVMARKVYREEAKAIEEIRKGIIAVSANEEPYDIFICYKETDENGGRTLDSVLAQDIYDILTDKGYRTFFARITLEDKLGQEYEPYIFAALNSAKIMLAVGTDYEYFNAVWVKNEWSRFLKLMAKDKTKHLIPCFKGIDAYDMPKEFARLQAQDLGKVGAMQDLMRGIEKILPKKNTTVIQERVVVSGGGDNKIASLLDRGNMALEDGDWVKADSFFEDVLNNDSKNAQAYLGKTLALEKCRTIDAFARKRKDASQSVRGEKLALRPNCAHVDEMVERFSLPGYVEQNTIRELYDFDLSYHSDVAERKQQYRSEENYWANHKQLSKAEKFAVGAVAENLAREKQALFAVLAERMKKAESAEAAAKKDVQSRYEVHLRQADEKSEALYSDGLTRREKYYQELLQIAKTSSDVAELTETAKKFEKLDGYQNSKKLAAHCRNRAAEEQAKIDTEAERQRIAKEKQEKARKAKKKKIGIVSTVVSVLAIAVIVVMTTVVIPGNHYKQAEALMTKGELLGAMELYYRHPGHKSCAERIAEFETQIHDQLAVGEWQDEEYVYEKDFESKGENYNVTLCHTICFEREKKTYSCTKNHNYYYSDSGRKHTSKCSEYTDDGAYQLLITDGILYVTGISDFVGMKLEAECEIQYDEIKLLALSGVVDMVGEDDHTTVLYCVTQEMREAEAQAQQEAAREENYEKAMACLENGQHQEAYEILNRLGDYRNAKEYLAQFVPILTGRTSTLFYGSEINIQYIYDDNMRLDSIEYDGELKYAFVYYEDGTLKQMEVVEKKNIRVHAYNEKGQPIFFGIFNNELGDYERFWVLEYTYDAEGYAQNISGSYFSEGEEGSYKWTAALSKGDIIEIPDLLIGPTDVTDIARYDSKISILRENGTIREEYCFQFIDFDTYKTGKDIDFIVSPYYAHELDNDGNAIYTKRTALSAGGSKMVHEQSFQMTYDDNGRLVEKRYNDRDSDYNNTLLKGMNGLNGENILTYAYDSNGLVTSIDWTLNGDELRTDVFMYSYVYVPKS